MQALPLALMAASTAISVGGSVLEGRAQTAAGKAQQQESNIEGAQLDQQAGQERAAAQRQAIEERRKARFAISRNQAVSAASGAGATDPTVLQLEGDITGEGEYNALTALYEGDDRARYLKSQGAATRFQGRSTAAAGKTSSTGTYFKAGSSLLSTAGSTLMAKYG